MTLRRSLVGTGIAAGAVALALGLTGWSVFGKLFEQVEAETLDWRVRAAGRFEVDSADVTPRAQASEIRLILFDELATQDWPYEQPYPRAVLAGLIDAAASLGASAIGLDVWLELRQSPELAKLDSLTYGISGDEMLRDAIARAGNVVLVGPSEFLTQDGPRGYKGPHPYFAEVAAALATADVPTAFETVRDAALTVRTEDGLLPGFVTALYAVSRDMDVDSLMRATSEQGYLALGSLPADIARLPDAPVQNMPLLFVGPPSHQEEAPGAFIRYSAADILALGEFSPREWFENRIILLGSGFHAEEKFRTPFYEEPMPSGESYGWTYGVEVHAHALENLLIGQHPTELPTAVIVLLYAFLAFATVAMTFLRGPGWGAVVAVALAVATVVTGWIVFDEEYSFLHVPFVGSVLTLALSYMGSVAYVSYVEGRQAREIRSAFKKYLAPAIVDQLAANPGSLKLGGEKRQISIIFTDLAGFTSLSETMDPEDLLSLLNAYLDEMSGIVLAEGGTLDKYIGDAIMAFYGAPLDQPDHAMRACRTAIRMQRRLARMNDEWRGTGRPHLGMRIGINTGSPVVGNIGGEQKFDYTALGDAVNLAARLEPACKTYGVDTMISKATRDAAGAGIVTRELELLAVYGKVEPVPVFELVGLADEDLGERAELLRLYEDGLAAYRRRDFELALQYFNAAVEVDPTDGPSRMYVERSRDYIASPPPVDWDFVERRQVK
ncbi:MAG TPA: adenylate/guanylate cyclase domain-containing protein [Longimicrobiales bacterium]